MLLHQQHKHELCFHGERRARGVWASLCGWETNLTGQNRLLSHGELCRGSAADVEHAGLVVGLQGSALGTHGEDRGQAWQDGGCLLDQEPDRGTEGNTLTLARSAAVRTTAGQGSRSLVGDVIFSQVLYLEGQFLLFKDSEGPKAEAALCSRFVKY